MDAQIASNASSYANSHCLSRTQCAMAVQFYLSAASPEECLTPTANVMPAGRLAFPHRMQ